MEVAISLLLNIIYVIGSGGNVDGVIGILK